jgi:predicted ATPase
MLAAKPYIRSVNLKDRSLLQSGQYPYIIPAVRQLDKLVFHPDMTFIIGENGTGKSTIIEAIAVALGFNPEGGTKYGLFEFNHTHSSLHENLTVAKSFKSPKDGYFLRAESFYNLASKIDEFKKEIDYGGESLHTLSHGEAFMATLVHKLRGEGIYIMDEPEAALSPARQIAALEVMHSLIQKGAQFIIATHAPILMAYPGAHIYQCHTEGIDKIDSFEDTEHYRVTKAFIENPKRILENLGKT